MTTAFAAVRRRFGSIDSLHNNAGVEGDSTPLLESTVGQLDALVAVNLRGLSGAAGDAPWRHRQPHGGDGRQHGLRHCALHAVPGMGQYAATKAAVIALRGTPRLSTPGAASG